MRSAAGVLTTGGTEVTGGEHCLGHPGIDIGRISSPGHKADPGRSLLPDAPANVFRRLASRAHHWRLQQELHDHIRQLQVRIMPASLSIFQAYAVYLL